MKICFCHNTSGNTDIRYKMLENTVQAERNAFPDCFHVSFSDGIHYKLDHPCLFEGKQLGHKVGCYHGMYKSLLLGYHLYDDCDYYVFSHDDVYLSNPDQFKMMLNMMQEQKIGFFGREFLGMGDHYYSFECVIFQYYRLQEFLEIVSMGYLPKTEDDFPKDFRNSASPEMLFGKMMQGVQYKKTLKYTENFYGENCFGYTHIENKRGFGWK